MNAAFGLLAPAPTPRTPVFARLHGPDFAPRLTAALRAVSATQNDTEWAALLEATTHFYALIFREAGHDIAWDIVQRLNGRISRLRALTLSATDRPVSGLSRMTAIYEAILSRDPKAARSAVHKHIDDASQTAQRYLKAETGTDNA